MFIRHFTDPPLSLTLFSRYTFGTIRIADKPDLAGNQGVLRYQLGLLVPKEKQKCHIFVNNRKYTWQEGRDVLFDDYYPHHVINASNETRVVLFLDVRRDLHNVVLNLLNRCFLYFIRFNGNVERIVNKINLFAKMNSNDLVVP